MTLKHSLLLLAFLLIKTSLFAQSLSFSGTNSYNITSPTHISAHRIPSLERTPTGMFFGDNGNKFYIIGAIGDQVIQYSLSSPYDVSTKAAIEKNFRVNNEESSPDAILFNTIGTRMYILGGSGDNITQYTLSTAWDVSTATTTDTAIDTFDAKSAINTFLGTTTNGDRLTGFTFNNVGSKLYISDRRSNYVFEFDLATDYDISSTGAVVNAMNIVGENNVRSITFNDDGTVLYVIGNQGDDINSFPLSIAYDLSSVGTSTVNVLPSTPDGIPQALLLNNDGTVFYIAGSADDEIKEYSLATGFDFSSIITFVTSYQFPTIETVPQGMVFNNDGTKLFVTGSQLDVVSELALSTPYDINTAIYTTGLYVSPEDGTPRGVAFNNTGTVLYVIGSQGDEINGYDLSSAYDLSSTITTTAGSPFSIVAEENNPTDIYFNNDGTKLYVLGNQGNDLNQYSLSPAYDLTDATTANLDIAFPLNSAAGLSIDSAPLGMAFNDDGSKLYIAGNSGNDINEISLSNAFDLSSGTITITNTFNISAEESTITDVIFNGDGSKIFICGTGGDDINQYYTKGLLPETPNNGTIDVSNPLVITLSGDTFADVDADNLLDMGTEFIIGNLPAGLTAVFTLSDGDTVATLTFTGKADSHRNSDEAAANMSFTFTDTAFTSSNAIDVENAIGYTDIMGFDFIECPDNEIVYNGAWTGGNNAGVPDNSGTDLALGIRVQGDMTITANTNCDCLHIESGHILTIADGVEFTIANGLEMDGELRLLGTAQLIQTHTGNKNTSGSGTLYKDVTGTLSNVYQTGYWSSPVTTNGLTYTIKGVLKDGTTPLAATGSPSDITFSSDLNGDPSTSPISLSTRWLSKLINAGYWSTQISETTELFSPGEGFSKKCTGNVSGQNYTFTGQPNDGDYIHIIDALGSGTWSLLGNPYPSALDIDTFSTDNATAIEGTLYFYESGNETSHTGSTYLGGYATRVAGVGNSAASLGDGSGNKVPGQYIGIGQGFFVVATATGGNITFNNAQRGFNTANVFFSKNNLKKSSSDFPILRIGFEFLYQDEIYHRPVTIAFRGLTNAFEKGFEAEMWDYKATDMALKIEGSTIAYAIAGIADFNTDLHIALKVKSDATRAITFKIDEIIDIDHDVFLYDKLTQTYHDISSNKAIITIDSGIYDDRFFITFNTSSLNSSPIENRTNNLFITNDQRELKISSENLLDKIEIYNLLGQKMYSLNNSLGLREIKINSTHFKKGIYIIKAKNSLGVITKKIRIH